MPNEDMIIFLKGRIQYLTDLKSFLDSEYLVGKCDGKIEAYTRILDIMKNDEDLNND